MPHEVVSFEFHLLVLVSSPDLGVAVIVLTPGELDILKRASSGPSLAPRRIEAFIAGHLAGPSNNAGFSLTIFTLPFRVTLSVAPS